MWPTTWKYLLQCGVAERYHRKKGKRKVENWTDCVRARILNLK